MGHGFSCETLLDLLDDDDDDYHNYHNDCDELNGSSQNWSQMKGMGKTLGKA